MRAGRTRYHSFVPPHAATGVRARPGVRAGTGRSVDRTPVRNWPVPLEWERARLRPRRPIPADRRPANRHRAPEQRPRRRRAPSDPARRHRLGQDLDRGERHPGAQQADARAGPQQDAGRAALRRVPGVLPEQRRRVLRQLLRLLPARGVPAAQRHLHREGLVTQRRDRPAAPCRDARPVRAPGRDHRRQRVVHLRPGRARRLRRDRAQAARRRQVPA